MQTTRTKKLLSLILCMVLIAAVALFAAGCGEQSGAAAADTFASGSTLGEGATAFTLTVTDGEGKQSTFEVLTDAPTVGEALLDVGIIAGEDSEYGLYVKTINGITADYDTDGTYWAFYINDEYAMTGVDATDVEAGASYTFRVEK